MGDEGVEQQETAQFRNAEPSYADFVANHPDLPFPQLGAMQHLLDEVARLKESLEILGGRADLEKMRADIAEERVARLQSELQQAQDELQGALIAEKAYISANNERIALLADVARLEKERDLDMAVCREQAHKVDEKLAAAEARIRELEGGKR